VAHPDLTTTRPPRPNEQIGAFADPSDHAIDHDLGVPDLPPRPASVPHPAYAPPPMQATPAVQPDYQPALTDAPDAYAPDAWAKPSGQVGGEPIRPVLPSDTALSGRLTGRPIDSGPPPRIDLQARPSKGKGKDGSADWARPKRFEAYPTLGRRIRLRGISPVLVGLFALMIAALVLFLLPGFLSGRGAGSASVKPSVVATVGEPTPTPAPTPQTYTVKGGDTLSGIAKSFGLTAEQVACFNNIKVTSILQIKQVLRIPPADYTCPPKGGTPRPSPSPKASASPH
jgi:LysM repeat protein